MTDDTVATSDAISAYWEGAFLSKDEVETVKQLIGGWTEGSLSQQTAKARALGRRLGMPDMEPEED